jgi:CRISPR-associated protein Cas2
MRIIVFFDLPTTTVNDLREYRKFRRYLIKNGFIMMQESVYAKMTLNRTAEKLVIDGLKKNKPPAGMVQAISVTEKQFSGMENICGKVAANVVDSDERIIIL